DLCGWTGRSHLWAMATIGQRDTKTWWMADLRHRFRGAQVRWGEAGEASVFHSVSQWRAAAQSQRVDGTDGLSPGRALYAAARRGLASVAESQCQSEVSQYLGPALGRL